jgi:hypothetical protein
MVVGHPNATIDCAFLGKPPGTENRKLLFFLMRNVYEIFKEKY